jgi:hypothetical protein
MTLEEIYAIPVGEDGWRVLPNGKNVKFGDHIQWTTTNIDATVGNGAKVGDGAVFVKSPLSVQGTRHLACQSAPGVISIGCQTHDFEYWIEHVIGIARQNGYTDEEGLEYQKIVSFIVANGIPAAYKAPE